MLVTTLFPLLAALIFYLILSLANPVELEKQYLIAEISRLFNINLIVLLPAIAIFLLAWSRVEIKISMVVSIVIAIVISKYIQGYSITEILNSTIDGFELSENTGLKDIILGGGIISMAKVCLVVIISTAFAGILTETRVLEFVRSYLNKTKTRSDLFLGTNLISIASAAFGCTQTIAILLTKELVKDNYRKKQLDNYQLALDLENSVVVISPLIPWNIAGFIPATILMTDSGFIPFAFYLYCLPIFYYLEMKISRRSID